MPSFSIAPAQLADAPEILALQSLNHVSNLPEATLPNGFVTTNFSLETLSEKVTQPGIWVARASSGELAAYACTHDWDFHKEGSWQSAVQAKFPLDFNGHPVTAQNSFQYGPVCIAAPYRGQGVLSALIETIKTYHAPRYDFGVTFIDTRNERSLAAHERKLGFRRLALLPFDTVVYHMLGFLTHEE